MVHPRVMDELVDVALEQSFPASDPPAFMAAAAVTGSPRLPRLPERIEADAFGARRLPAMHRHRRKRARRSARKFRPMPLAAHHGRKGH